MTDNMHHAQSAPPIIPSSDAHAAEMLRGTLTYNVVDNAFAGVGLFRWRDEFVVWRIWTVIDAGGHTFLGVESGDYFTVIEAADKCYEQRGGK